MSELLNRNEKEENPIKVQQNIKKIFRLFNVQHVVGNLKTKPLGFMFPLRSFLRTTPYISTKTSPIRSQSK